MAFGHNSGLFSCPGPVQLYFSMNFLLLFTLSGKKRGFVLGEWWNHVSGSSPPHSWHLFNWLNLRIWWSWAWAYKGKAVACFVHPGCQESCLGQSHQQTEAWDSRTKSVQVLSNQSWHFKASGCHLPLLFQWPWSRISGKPKWSASWSFYHGRWAPWLDFMMGSSVASGLDLSPRRSANQQMGCIWSLLVPHHPRKVERTLPGC